MFYFVITTFGKYIQMAVVPVDNVQKIYTTNREYNGSILLED